jgi:rsbT co-antagonist protein RsbR
MKNEAIKILQKKRKSIFESWMKFQLQDEGLRDDLMTNDDLRKQSEELLDTIISNLTDVSLDDPNDGTFEPVREMLSDISITRARTGI